MNDLIFGHTWEQIQAAQQGKPYRKYIVDLPPSNDIEKYKKADLALLEKYGIKKLKEFEYYGVIDRLVRGGEISQAELDKL